MSSLLDLYKQWLPTEERFNLVLLSIVPLNPELVNYAVTLNNVVMIQLQIFEAHPDTRVMKYSEKKLK